MILSTVIDKYGGTKSDTIVSRELAFKKVLHRLYCSTGSRPERLAERDSKKMLKNSTELILVMRIGIFLFVLPLMVRKLQMGELIDRITPAGRRRREDSPSMERIIYLCERILRLFQRAGYTYSCLRRCILMYHFLRSYEFPVTINFGAAWDEGKLMGHSWLSLDGDIIFDKRENIARFVHFFSLPMDDGGTDLLQGKEKEYLNKAFFD
jgi:hypothetical protein